MIHHGDCLDILPTLDDESVDAVITDPPYGLKFMGKDWDHGVPGVPYWQAVGGVLKPGAFLVAFGGTRTHHRLMVAIEDAGFEIRDCLMWLHGQGFPKGKSQLKPAWEPIILARKAGPLPPLNIDECRIHTAGSEAKAYTVKRLKPGATLEKTGGNWRPKDGESLPWESGREYEGTTKDGRWPANVVLDEEAARLLDEQSGHLVSNSGKPFARTAGKTRNSYGAFPGNLTEPGYYGDNGGASRFFYCAKASPSERGRFNDHPTVKPLALMRWLVRLVTPSGGVVLDPFLGSGTTALACQREGFECIGIERDEHSVEIAARRLMQPSLTLGLEVPEGVA